MSRVTGANRRFLFLQGPHGPFFAKLARQLRAAGAEVWRVGFNAGDRAFWPDAASFLPFRDPHTHWPSACQRLLSEKRITDLVLYGDARPIHVEAIALARALKITIHVFEEGYLRPYWVTYERGGSNGNSPLQRLTVDHMRAALRDVAPDLPDAPPQWGALRQHVFYGALYHFCVLALNRGFPHFTPHREITVAAEFRLYFRRLLKMPFHALQRIMATRRIKSGSYPYHIVLLQLAHDASFRAHGPFSSMEEFIHLCTEGFAKGAPAHHHLVFKAHPLEDGRAPIGAEIRRLAREYGIEDRVHFLRGGKLAALLDSARSAVTVNSTAAQQVLWRGMPLKAFGNAVYSKPEFVSDQSLDEFFGQPLCPDARAYRDYRHYLLETSQLRGSFYSASGRHELLRRAVDLMLAETDPYAALTQRTAALPQQLRRVH